MENTCKKHCDICGIKVCSNYSLRRHYVRKHVLKRRPIKENLATFVCKTCGKKYNYENNLKKHIALKHNSAKVLVCGICFSSVTSNLENTAEMDKHIFSKHKKEAYSMFACKICQKMYPDLILLNKHFNTHERRFKCSKCVELRLFKNKAQLRKHEMRRHENMGKFKCQFCAGEFMTEESRKIHIETQHRLWF